MGFDLFIQCSFSLCPKTGKPYYYTVTDGKLDVIYGIPDITVPEEFRPYVRQRGHHFHAYTTSRAESEHSMITEMSVLSFLDQYPDWMDVLVDVNYDTGNGWTKDDHYKFKKALEWFAEQMVDFSVHWSY
jgi:hypothetical protein